MKLKVALAQYPIDLLPTIEAWKNKLIHWVEEARSKGAQLLVFPEYASFELTPMLDSQTHSNVLMQLTPLANLFIEQLLFMQCLVDRSQVTVIAPSCLVPNDEGQIVNRAHIFVPSKDFIYQDKFHLTRFEREVLQLTPPRKFQLQTFNVGEGIQVGVQICFDVEFPQLSRQLAERGVQLLCSPSCTEGVQGFNRVHLSARARALENQFFVGVAQTIGEAPWSLAIDANYGAAAMYAPPDLGFPDDGVVAYGRPNRAGWIYSEIDSDLVEKVRTQGQVFNYQLYGQAPRP